MYKYKKGDRVKIKSELWYLLNKDNDGRINRFNQVDSIFCGKTLIYCAEYEDRARLLLPTLDYISVDIKCIRHCLSINYIICKVVKFVKSKVKRID